MGKSEDWKTKQGDVTVKSYEEVGYMRGGRVIFSKELKVG